MLNPHGIDVQFPGGDAQSHAEYSPGKRWGRRKWLGGAVQMV